ncbi:unnamed protein product [marine sediment metagenome]|uniref:DUF1566 domain-containing protein n=1 Tax=marine sediment metagenome TaxID=412755 RepID=X1E3Z0_9ZZZZ
MKRLGFVFIAVLTALIFTGCPGTGSDPTPDPVTYALGDPGPAGGWIFYIDEADEFSWDYLEAAPSDQSAPQVWIEGGETQTTENGNTLTAIGTGQANSDAIIAQTDHTGSAAKICLDYDDGTYSDWFLPSQYELNEMYTNLHDQVPAVGGFSNDDYGYWSSSEGSANSARVQYFYNGEQNVDVKSYALRVRAVRAF